MTTTHLAVTITTPQLQQQAKALAKQLHLPFTTEDSAEFNYLLVITPDYLGLQKTGEKFHPLYVDFLSGKMIYRYQHASLKREALARALGLKGNTTPKIIDATGGLGRDSFILACLGFNVQILERSPIIFALLQDGIARAAKDNTMATIIKRLHIIQENAIFWLPSLTSNERPDMIYLDPMFPERTKSALVKKEMRIFHDIVGDDLDADRLLTTALSCATQRVVVKRPRYAKSLSNIAPSFTLAGSSSRFDVYIL